MKTARAGIATALTALLLAGFLVGLAVVLNRELSRRMAELQEQSVAALEQFIGRKISYASISPSFLRSLEIRDLRITRADGSGETLLVISRLRLYYSLARLLTGRDPAAALNEIRIVSSQFTVDLDRDKDLAELVSLLAVQAGGAGDLQARLTGANVGVTVVSSQGTFDLTGLFFEVDPERDLISVAARGSCTGVLKDGFQFSSSLKTAGKVGRQLDWSDLTLRVMAFSSSVFSTGRQTLQMVWKGHQLTLSKIQDRSPVDVQLSADFDARTVSLSFRAEQFQPDKLFRLSGSLARYNPWLKAPITAAGTAIYGLDDHSLAYQADVQAYFEDQLPVRDANLASSLHGTGRQIWLVPLSLSSPTGSLEFTGNLLFENFFPEGMLTLSDFDAWQGDKVNASVVIARLGGRLEITGSRAAVGDIGFDRLEARLEPAGGGMRFSLQASFEGLQDDELEASGSLVKGNAAFAARLRSVPVDRLYHLGLGAIALSREQKDIKAFLEPLSLTADIEATTDLKSFLVKSPRVRVVRRDQPDSHLSAGVELASDHLSVIGLEGAWQGISVQGDLRGQMQESEKIAFSAGLRVQGLPYALSGTYSLAAGLAVTGSYGLSIAASRTRTGVLAVMARAERFPLPTADKAQIISFEAEGVFAPDGEWSISSPSIQLFDVPFLASLKNSLQVSLRLDPRKLELPRIRFSDEFSQLEGTLAADIAGAVDPLSPRFLQELSVLISGSLAARGSTEAYSVKGGLEKGVLGVQLELNGSPVARLGDFAVKGLLTGRGSITGPLAAPAVEVTLALKEGKLGTDALSASGKVRVAAGALTMTELAAVYVSHRFSGGTGTFDLNKGGFSLQAFYAGEFFTDTVKLSMGLRGTFSARDWEVVAARPFQQDIVGQFTLSGITVNAVPLPSWSIALSTADGSLRLDGGPGDSIHGILKPDMSFAISTRAPLPVEARAEGRIVGDRILTTLDVSSADLRVLNAILKSPIISFTSGVASGRLSIAGPVNDPDFLGSLEVIGGGILCRSYSPDEAGPISTRFTFDGRGFHSEPIVATVGSARMSGQAAFTMDHWVPVTFDISLATVEGTAAHLAAKFGSLNVDGRGVGGARIVGNERRTDITGSLVVSDCRISLGPYPGGDFIAEDPPTYANFSVETGKRVEFLWPSETFPVLRATASPGGTAAVTYRGDTGGYRVTGSADILGGEIFYFDRSFIMKSGTIAFDETEVAFDPRITARAEVREWDPETGEAVKIYLDADSRLSTFSPRFSSDPSRTDVEILAMIGAPIFSRTEDQGLGVSALMLSGDILSQFGILRPFEQRIRKLLNLDMFSIRTQIVQNLLAEKLFGATVNPLDNTAVSLGKYLGNDLFLEMLVRLQSRPAAAGSSSPAEGLASEVELNIEWATPFFLLEWSFLPKTPETLFLADNSLSMKWRYSY